MRRLLVLVAFSGCAAPPPKAAPHHHELHLAPPGPTVKVTFEGRAVDVPLPRDGKTVPLARVWTTAMPDVDPAPLKFDLFGSDGFHPMARPACPRLLTSEELAAGAIDVDTHDVTYAEGVKLPGCYRVHGVVRLDAVR